MSRLGGGGSMGNCVTWGFLGQRYFFLMLACLAVNIQQIALIVKPIFLYISKALQ